jgi:NTE family protein
MPKIPHVTGLVLTGGGARAAYQVGVLKALAQIRREAAPLDKSNPFPVIAGTSSGAINAAALASHCDNFDEAVSALASVWENFSADQVYRSDALGVLRTGARWLTMMSLGWLISRWRRARQRSLLDNSPLEALLHSMVKVDRLPALMQAGHLQALAVTASSYSSGTHVTFYDSLHRFEPWHRTQRIAVRSTITVPHLLASAAIPFVFPPVSLPLHGGNEYFGDGSMRQSAPISPAVHLGANRIVVIGAGRLQEPTTPRHVSVGYPNLAQIAGHALSNIFLDALAVDIERLQRINNTLSLLPREALKGTSLRPIDLLVIAPTQRLDDMAGPHIETLPKPVRALLRGIGVSGKGRDVRGAALASYLLFESSYTKDLMALGMADTLSRRGDVVAFFGWGRPPAPAGTFTDSGFYTAGLG